jgi:hypothetical protein
MTAPKPCRHWTSKSPRPWHPWSATPSTESKKLIARRVPTSWIPKYDVMDEYGFIIWDEASSILDRILVYPATASYRKHLKAAPKDILAAWQFHSHSLRIGELYIVLDRTNAILDFLNPVATDCGLPAVYRRKVFEAAFKNLQPASTRAPPPDPCPRTAVDDLPAHRLVRRQVARRRNGSGAGAHELHHEVAAAAGGGQRETGSDSAAKPGRRRGPARGGCPARGAADVEPRGQSTLLEIIGHPAATVAG